MEHFFCKTKIIVGSQAEAQLQSFSIRRLFLVTDPYFAQSGDADRIAQLSGAKETEIFSDITPDPSAQLAARGAAAVKSFAPDAVVALGGGSAMDCAIAMGYFSGLTPKLIAIPTNSGSGSEVTDFAILTHEGVKHPLVDDSLRPDAAILDDSLLQNLPPKLIADTGFDLLSHALEAWAATGAGAFSDALASDAFCTAYSLLPLSFAGGRNVRLRIHTASTMAGLAFSLAGLGICHALSHALGGEFHIPHGRINAILLPAVIDQNAHAAGSRYASLARRAGFSTGSDAVAIRALKNALIRLRRSLQMPDNLAQAGVSPTILRQKTDAIVTATLADPCCATNPAPVTDAMVRRILSDVMGHG